MDVAAERTGTAALAIPGFAAPAHPCAMYLQRVLGKILSSSTTSVDVNSESLFRAKKTN